MKKGLRLEYKCDRCGQLHHSIEGGPIDIEDNKIAKASTANFIFSLEGSHVIHICEDGKGIGISNLVGASR